MNNIKPKGAIRSAKSKDIVDDTRAKNNRAKEIYP